MAGTSTVYGGHGPPGDVYFNYTPLVDVTFNLILYFVLTSTINTSGMARVVLASPEQNISVEREKTSTNSIIVNVLSKGLNENDNSEEASIAKQYEIDAEVIDLSNLDRLVKKFRDTQAAKKATNPDAKPEDFFVEIRADRRVQYVAVEPIMTAAAAAGIKKMSFTTIIEPPGARNQGGSQ